MTVNPLPPQAYTKETLQKAYAWLLNQSSSVKEMATSQDVLVSLYLKTQRNGEGALETPSIQNFKQELKNIANMIGDFQSPQSSQASQNNAYTTALPTYASPQIQQNRSMPQTFVNNSGNAMNNAGPVSTLSLGSLDDGSLSAIQEVKAALNLSSDLEAMRALISLGYKQFKKI